MNCHVLSYAWKPRNCRWLNILNKRPSYLQTGNSRSHLLTMSASTVRFNHLKNERSPYLLQHANNPVNWFPWGDDAINQARNENKLIFLSVGYSTCHWCHVMERESFENENVAAIMNEHFVNIKVDREERPDVDKTYMTFVQLTSGSGGWPMSVFLTPDLNPVAGGTYFPPEDKWGRAGFKTVLLKIAKQWKENPEDLRRTGDKVIDLLRKASTFDLSIVGELTKGSAPELECAKVCVHQLSRHYDEEFGGFAIAPKFAMPTNLMFLFHFYARNTQAAQSKSALAMALKTLEMMNKGGIHDHIGQGFARYSTDEKWHVPHFEKMLYDQGQLAVAYATAFLITKKALFSDILRDILTYVDRDLSHKKGGFYSAEDADSLPAEGDAVKKEGAFYVWEFGEIETLLDQPLKVNESVRLSDVFNHHYNVRPNGNVEAQNDPHGELIDRNVLIVLGSEEETAEKFSISVTDLNEELQAAREILFKERNKRPRPHLDSKIITSWNGLMLSGFSKAAQVLYDDQFKDRAIKAATFIKEHLWQSDAQELLHCCYVDDNRENVVQIAQPIQGFLNDYVFLIRGLLDLYESTYDASWIEWCDQLQATQDRLFWDEANKAYNMANADDHSVLLTLKDDQDGVEPAGNSVAVQNLLRLSTLLQRDDYLKKAKHVLSAFTSRLNRLPESLPEMASTLMFYHDSSTQIFVVQNNDADNAREMLSAAHKYYIPNRVLALLDGDENSILYRESEIIRNMKARGKSATAHVCRNGVCSEPVTSVPELEALLNGL